MYSSIQGTEFEFTVVQKLNQGTNRNRAVSIAGSFFVSFLEKQKRKIEKIFLYFLNDHQDQMQNKKNYTTLFL